MISTKKFKSKDPLPNSSPASRHHELFGPKPARRTGLLVQEVHDGQRGPREVNEVVGAIRGEVLSCSVSLEKKREPFLGKIIFSEAATKKRKKGATEQLRVVAVQLVEVLEELLLGHLSAKLEHESRAWCRQHNQSCYFSVGLVPRAKWRWQSN